MVVGAIGGHKGSDGVIEAIAVLGAIGVMRGLEGSWGDIMAVVAIVAIWGHMVIRGNMAHRGHKRLSGSLGGHMGHKGTYGQ